MTIATNLRRSRLRTASLVLLAAALLASLAVGIAADPASAAVKLKTKTPRPAAQVSGKITWRVATRGRVKYVRYYIDGRRVWTDRRAPFRYGRHRGRLNTLNLKNGPHRLKAVAKPRHGRRRVSSVRIYVVNGLAASAGSIARARDYAASHVRIDWPATGGADEARIYRGDLLLASRPASIGHYTDSMLWFSTTYQYRVELLSGGNVVQQLGPISATTAPLPPGGYSPTMANSSVWSSPIPAGAATYSRSAEFVDYITARTRNANMPTRAYGIPVYEAEANDPRFGPLACVYGCNINALGPVPIPSFAAPDPGSDAHMTVISSDGTAAWDYYKPVKNTAGIWTGTSAGVRIEMNGEGIVPKNLGGANAANFANLGGIVRPEEIAQGAIGHALVLGIPGIASGRPACPAVKNVGVNGGIIPEGTRFQLDPALDVSALGLPAWQQTIARALQVYGAYVRDNAGVLSIYGETSSATLGGRRYDGWAKAGSGINAGQSSQQFSAGFPWNRLRAIDFTYC